MIKIHRMLRRVKIEADAINSYLEEGDSHDKDTQDVEEG